MVWVTIPTGNEHNRSTKHGMTDTTSIRVYPAVHRLRLLSRYLRGSTVCPGLPPTIVIANTHSCNHFCRMCIREAVAFNGPNIEVRLFRKLIDEGARYFRYISL